MRQFVCPRKNLQNITTPVVGGVGPVFTGLASDIKNDISLKKNRFHVTTEITLTLKEEISKQLIINQKQLHI